MSLTLKASHLDRPLADLWNILAKELPKNVGRLREAMHKFGVPPYVLDLQNCVVIQATFFYGETRRTTLRHQVLEPAAYSIMVDRQHMFPHGALAFKRSSAEKDKTAADFDARSLRPH